MGLRVVAVVAGLLTAAACSSAARAATLTCHVSLGKQAASVVLNSASTTRTSLGVGQLTGQFSRAGATNRLSIFGPSRGDGGVYEFDGRGPMKIGVQVSGGYLRASCRE